MAASATSPVPRCSRSMGEVEVRSTEGEADREARKMPTRRPDHPHPALCADLSRFAGEVKTNAGEI